VRVLVLARQLLPTQLLQLLGVMRQQQQQATARAGAGALLLQLQRAAQNSVSTCRSCRMLSAAAGGRRRWRQPCSSHSHSSRSVADLLPADSSRGCWLPSTLSSQNSSSSSQHNGYSTQVLLLHQQPRSPCHT
jgi:hypothetical protein